MNFKTKQGDYKKIFSILETVHQPTMLELFSNRSVFQQLVAVMLSARTKDSTVIPLAKRLFSSYPGPKEFLKIERKVLEKELHGIGFYRVKAKNLQKLSQQILEEHQGIVPNNFEDLVKLPGVGRKTANCILASTFRQPAIGVDTHVHRISNRLGWVNTNVPEETEESLKQKIPSELWIKVNPLLVDHGQRICQPLKPKCDSCKIIEYCEYGKRYEEA